MNRMTHLYNGGEVTSLIEQNTYECLFVYNWGEEKSEITNSCL